MKILIIGSEGFIGNHCVYFFIKNGYEVSGCDLIDRKNQDYNYFKISKLAPCYDEVFSSTNYDLCINASGNGNVQTSISHPIADFEANCTDVVRILEKLRANSPDCKYLHISSAAVYGNPAQLPVSEISALNPISPYGWHKLIAEKICDEYVTLYGMKIAIIRPFSVYGPFLRKQLFWDLYKKIKNSPDKIDVFGNGSESRDFIYIKDLVQLIDLIFKYSSMSADIYNAGNGQELRINDTVHKFINLYNPQTQILFSNQQLAGNPINWVADISSIKKLGYQQKYSLDEGLTELTLWMKSLI